MAKYLPAIHNEIDSSDTSINLLLGFSRYIFNGFKLNNIQMTGDWYLNDIEESMDYLASFLRSNNIKNVNIIGTSKSNTGAFLFTNNLANLFPEIQFRVFAFSSYTTIEKSFYEENGLIGFIPSSLHKVWNDPEIYTPEHIARSDAKTLENRKNISLFLLYPELSRGGEPELARRVEGDNITHIPMKLRFHSIIFPFWKKLLPGKKIELFEGQVKELPVAVFSYLQAMQAHSYPLNLYSMLTETQQFIDELAHFDRLYQETSRVDAKS